MKNKKSLIFNGIVLLFSILTFVFLAFPAIEDVSGYQMLGEVFNGYVMGMPILFLTIMMGLLLITTVLVLLCDFNVIKNKKFELVVNKIAFYLAVLIAFLYLVVIAMVIGYANMVVKLDACENIENIIIDIAACVLVIINQKVFRK